MSVEGSGPSTVALLTSVAGPASGETAAFTRITGAVTPAARAAALVQVMTWPFTTQAQPAPEIEAVVAERPTGNVSVTTIAPGEFDGPKFFAVRVKVTVFPASTAPAGCVFVIEKLARGAAGSTALP